MNFYFENSQTLNIHDLTISESEVMISQLVDYSFIF